MGPAAGLSERNEPLNVISKLFVGVALLGSVGVIIGANLKRDLGSFQFKWELQREVPLEVRLDRATVGKLIHAVSAPGDVEADIEVKVSSQVMGKLVKLPVLEGDKVKKGDLLAQIEATEFEALVRQADARVQRLRSSIESADVDLAKAKRDVDANKTLYLKGSLNKIAFQDLETLFSKMMAVRKMVQSELVEAEAMKAKAQKDLDNTTVRATIDGVISQLDAKEGETVVVGTMNQPGSKIMTVSDMNTIVVRARVDETDRPLVKLGQRAIIHVQYGEELNLSGTVMRIAPKGIKGLKGSGGAGASAVTVANPNDVAVFETFIKIENPPPQVQLGMTANVDIQVDDRTGILTLSSQAVLHRRLRDLPRRLADELERKAIEEGGEAQTRYYQVVFVNNKGVAECRLVKTGISDETRVEILEGLKEGEQVISGPYRVFDKLKDGRAIKEMTDESGAI